MDLTGFDPGSGMLYSGTEVVFDEVWVLKNDMLRLIEVATAMIPGLEGDHSESTIASGAPIDLGVMVNIGVVLGLLLLDCEDEEEDEEELILR